MSRYPQPLTRSRYSYVHLPGNQIYQHLQNEVHNTIRLEAATNDHIWTINGIRRKLLTQYGGALEDYKVKKQTVRAILITLPPWLSREVVLTDNVEWATTSGLLMTPYRDETNQFVIPQTYMVRMKITQCPLSLWHQNFFAVALAPMGELAEIHAINEIGDERAFLRVWIHCRDPYRISDYLVLNFEDKWVQCPVTVELGIQ
jgi:hypothetical protein